MKKLITILLLLPVLGFGQTGHWEEADGITYTTDSTAYLLLNATDTVYLINIDSLQLGLNYISLLSNVFIVHDFDNDAINDTLAGTCTPKNYNKDSLFFSRIEEMVIDSDSALIYPYRITEFEKWGVATDRDLYYNIDFTVTPTMTTVCASGCDATTIQGGINISSATDTVIVYSGDYDVGNFVNVNRQLYIKALGECNIINNTAQSQCLYLDADNIIFEGFNVKSNASTYTAYYVVQSNVELRNCRLSGADRHEVFLRGVSTSLDTNYITNCVLEGGNSTYSMIQSRDCSHIIAGTKFTGKNKTVGFQDITVIDNEYSKAILWCDSDVNYTTFAFIGYATKYNKFVGNRVRANILNYAATDISSYSTFKDVRIRSNDYIIDSSQSISDGFIKNTTTASKYFIDNNSIVINSRSIAIFLYSEYDVTISNNYIDLYRGTTIAGRAINDNSVTFSVLNNELNTRFSPDGGGDYNVNFDYLSTVDTLRYMTVDFFGNIVRNPMFYGSVGGGHTGLYFGNIRTKRVAYNYFVGAEVAAIVDKGVTNTTEGIESFDSYTAYNIFDSCGYIIKGVRNINTYNNTFITPYLDNAITIFTNQDVAPNEDAANNTLYNNIFYLNTPTKYAYEYQTQADTVGAMSDHNVIFGNDTLAIAGTTQTIESVKSFGWELNSLNSDPKFNSLVDKEFWGKNGSPLIDNGFYLGEQFNQALDIVSAWPDGLVFKTQLVNWDIGAYSIAKKSFLYKDKSIIKFGNSYIYLNN